MCGRYETSAGIYSKKRAICNKAESAKKKGEDVTAFFRNTETKRIAGRLDCVSDIDKKGGNMLEYNNKRSISCHIPRSPTL